MPRAAFNSLTNRHQLVPFPMHTAESGKDHFAKYEDIVGSPTSDVHMPSYRYNDSSHTMILVSSPHDLILDLPTVVPQRVLQQVPKNVMLQLKMRLASSFRPKRFVMSSTAEGVTDRGWSMRKRS